MNKLSKKKSFDSSIISYPKKFKSLYSYEESTSETSWSGNGLDILLGFLVLYVNHRNVIFPYRSLTYNKDDFMWKLLIRYSCYKGNDYKLTLPVDEGLYFNFIQEYINKYKKRTPTSILLNKKTQIKTKTKTKKINIKQKGGKSKRRVRFIIFGLYLGDKTCDIQKGHFNLAIFDIKNMTIERYEPYGKSMSDEHFEKTFDKDLEALFQKNGIKVKVISPSEYIPKKSFQYIEEFIQIPAGKGSKKRSDPFGFCGPWSIWYCSLRLKNPNLPPKKLIRKALKILINEDKPLRDFIRNYSQHYLKQSKALLGRKKIYGNDGFNKETFSLEERIQHILINN